MTRLAFVVTACLALFAGTEAASPIKAASPSKAASPIKAPSSSKAASPSRAASPIKAPSLSKAASPSADAKSPPAVKLAKAAKSTKVAKLTKAAPSPAASNPDPKEIYLPKSEYPYWTKQVDELHVARRNSVIVTEVREMKTNKVRLIEVDYKSRGSPRECTAKFQSPLQELKPVYLSSSCYSSSSSSSSSSEEL